jgi:NADH-quinone oxidoreductase subunit A
MGIIALVFACGSLTVSYFLGHKKSNPDKLIPYECGTVPVGDARQRYPVRYYIVAMLFIVFDIEAAFMYPWAVLFKDLGWFGFIEMAVFMAILLIGLIYVWQKGALEWE